MNQYCVFINHNSVTTITGTQTSGGAWPGTLVASPRTFQYNSITYNLNQEGIYKFSVPIQNTTNMIIYDGDVLKLMESLSYFLVPGQDNEGWTNAQLNTRALTSRIHVMCSSSVVWSGSWLSTLGIPWRMVRVIRSDTPNNFYDGHVIMEVKINNQWKLFDPSIGFKFVDGCGNLLALKDVCPMQSTTPFQYLHALKDILPSEQLFNGVYHHSSTVDMFLANDAMLKEWQMQIMQIPGIVHTDGKTYFYMPSGTEGRQSWLQGLSTSYVVVSHATWLEMFY